MKGNVGGHCGRELGGDTNLVTETRAGQARRLADPPMMDFRWASETGAHGMIRVADAERDGWVKMARHPWWRRSWLMRRAA